MTKVLWLVAIFLLFHDLEGHHSFEEQILQSSTIFKGKILSKFENEGQTEVTVKVMVVYKGNKNLFTFLRLKLTKCKLKLGSSYIFFDNKRPIKASKRVTRKIKKLSCEGCGKLFFEISSLGSFLSISCQF